MIDKFYKQICPFCGKDHKQRLHINIICCCGSKYYFKLGKWYNRTTGEWKRQEAFVILENNNDVAEVVRCKDCKWRQQDDVNRNFCGLGDFYCGDTDFCSRGERKDNGN